RCTHLKMHHLYPLAKGDPLCPLGFHPQVRWPTRCKRCFRDYKEHGGKKRDDNSSLRRDGSTLSTPSLSWNSSEGKRRSWVSSSNLAGDHVNNNSVDSDYNNPSSWTSTPDLANLQDDTQPVTTVISDSFSLTKDRSSMFNKTDSLAERAKKLQAIKESTAQKGKRIQIKEVKTISEEPSNNDVQFLIQSPQDSSDNDDTISLAGTETTDTTLVDAQDCELRDQLETAMETTTSKTTASEVLKLQQKCNELQQHLEDYKDEKRSLSLRVKELEEDLEQRPTAQQAQKIADEVRSKLLAAETLCEELMDENEDIKKELRDMEEQMDELQDNFREDQAVEYTSLKKRPGPNHEKLSNTLFTVIRMYLEQISGGGTALNQMEKIKQLEQELKIANEVSLRFQKELEEANQKPGTGEGTKTLKGKKKTPLLGNIGKTPSTDGKKVSRESLTRGGSQDDPAQLLRDLQDSLEREADLREQLKFAEEEKNGSHIGKPVSNKFTQTLCTNFSIATQTDILNDVSNKTIEEMESKKHRDKLLSNLQLRNLPMSKMYLPARIMSPMSHLLSIMGNEFLNFQAQTLRKKVSRIEDDNESLVLQLKKMATRARSRKLSPTNQRLTPEPAEKEVADDDDPTEVKLQLELSEQEASVLRKKVEELEADVHRLKAKNKELQDKYTAKSTNRRSLLGSDNSNSISNQKLKVLEDEVNDLRKKIIEKERDCERLHAELSLVQKRTKGMQKSKSLDLDQQTLDLKRQLQVTEQEATVLRNKYIDQIATLEVELAERDQKISELEDALNKGLKERAVDLAGEYRKFNQRIPKKVTSTTSRDQLKTMVTDLEKEIAEMLMKTASEIESALKDLEMLNKKYDSMKEELEEEKSKNNEENKTKDNLNRSLRKTKEDLELANEENKKLQEKIDKLNKEQIKLNEEKETINKEIKKLKTNLKNTTTSTQDEIMLLTRKNESLKLSLEEKDSESQQLKQELEEKDKNALKDRKLQELESELTKFENRYLETDKKLRQQNKDFDSKIDKEKQKIKSLESDQAKWEEDRKKLNQQVDNLNTKIKGLENTIDQKNKLVKQLEDSLTKEREIVSKTNLKVGEVANREIGKLKDEKWRINYKKELQAKLKKAEQEYKTAKIELDRKNKELEIDLQNEKKKLEVLRNNSEKEQRNREMELTALKAKIKKLELSTGGGIKKELEIKQFQEAIEKLEATIARERQKYDDLTGKYEILEEEHVVTKAKLVMEKETLEKLKALLEEKQSDYDQIKKECDSINDQMDFMRRENDELKKQLDDYEKVNKVQRNISADSSAMEKRNETPENQVILNNAERGKKSDLAELKMRYESQINVVNAELQSLQNQVVRFKREKDTYKHMLESAQKTIGDLKQSPKAARRGSHNINYDELEESKSKVANLEQQISCMEDEFSEARLECSRLKTELVSERSTYEVKLSELHSRVNELEEEKVLNSGRTKVAGLRTKMELAWQKEREEQQRLLQETATLARDLRQTLFEVERERDKERLEAKRKQDQFKKTSEEEQDENKRKITELQCDLLELRDAHAKLRTTNEKLRREKERYEKEREDYRSAINGRKRLDQEDERKINALVEQMDTLKQLAPELFFSRDNEAPYTPTPPRRTKSKSRESSPAFDRRESSMGPEEKTQQIQYIMQRLVHTTEDLRRLQRMSEDEVERERIRRSMGGMRRATSSEHENVSSSRYSTPFLRKTSVASHGSLKRKSLSLEHTTQAEQKIWNNDDSLSSLTSLELHSDIESSRARRDTSLDSRLSSESTQSELGDKKRRKQNSNSDLEDNRGSKKDLKERITGIFRRSGSSSRSNSVERRHETSSLQRPLVRNESNTHATQSSDTDKSHKTKPKKS
ncbi:hypothetical protein NQ317_009982, partial [Molorchus minor]